MPFALLACPDSLGQLKQGRPLLRLLPNSLSSAVAPWLKSRVLEQLKVGKLTGMLWEFPLLPGQVTSLPSRRVSSKIQQTAQAVRESGARILGLDLQLHTLAPEFRSWGLRVATGATLATVAALNLALHLSQAPPQHCRVLVVNPAGGAGQAAARVLARHVRYLTLMGNYLPSLERLARRILMETGTAAVIIREDPAFYAAADIILDFRDQRPSVLPMKPGAVVWQPFGSPQASSPATVYFQEAVLGTGLQLPLEAGLPPGVVRAASAEALLMTAAFRAPWPQGMFDVTPDRLLFAASLTRKLGLSIAGYQGSCFTDLKYLTNPVKEFIIC